MSENDYIAEYIKLKHPSLLGMDFQLWKMGRAIVELGKDIAASFEKIKLSEEVEDDENGEDQGCSESDSRYS